MNVRMLAVALCSLLLGNIILFPLIFMTTDSFVMLSSPRNFGSRNENFSLPIRKLLLHNEPKEEPNRLPEERCTRSDIVINQSPSIPLASGIPTYTVEITNTCFTGCNISRIHLSCGWFSSDQLIEPKTFKRLNHHNICLVNNGKPLPYGSTLSFQYANSHSYPLSIYSLACP